MKRITVTILTLFFTLFLFADEKILNLTVSPAAESDSLRLYFSTLGAGSNKVVEMQREGDKFSAKVNVSPDGLYQLTAVKGYLQMFQYLYLPGNESVNVNVSVENKSLITDFNADNKAISHFNYVKNSNDRKLWDKDVCEFEAYKSVLDSYASSGNEAVAMAQSENVKEFIKVWSRVSAYDACYSIRRKGDLPKNDAKELISSTLDNVLAVLDSDYSIYFPAVQTIVRDCIDEDMNLVQEFEYFYAKFSNERIRNYINELLVDRFVSTHNYNDYFDSGLDQLTTVVEKYSLDRRYIAEYESRRATIKGTPFPADVVLRDANGNTVDFSKFRGKYVYIDMWASWCIPCAKEVPHLKKLESELQNENVVFVSISMDKKTDPWIKKMNALDMHGYQLINADNRLSEVLNVSGIPFFLIYDKEGKLFIYNAPRPSSGEVIMQLLEGLK